MSIYKTYQEAVIANGETQGVCTTGDDWAGSERYRGYFTIMDAHETIAAGAGAWIECNPADYLESLEDFHTRGLSLVIGDRYTEFYGMVSRVDDDDDERCVNQPSRADEKRFVVKATAYDTETPEEKEAFDAMTDTAPQQFGSLSSSEKPNNSEWNGEGLPPAGVEFDFSSNGISWEPRIMLFNDGITCLMAHREYPENRWHYKCDDPDLHFRKPETPEQRAERERDELAKQIMIDLCGEDVFDKRDWNYHKKFTEAANQAFKLVDLGYRKE